MSFMNQDAYEKRIAELERDLESARKHYDTLKALYDQVYDGAEAARIALEKYGTHDLDHCGVNDAGSCNCGLTAAIVGAHKATIHKAEPTPQLQSFIRRSIEAFGLLDKVRARIADCPHCFDVLAAEQEGDSNG